MKEHLSKTKQHLLNGVSFAIPFIACGGILIAFAIAVNGRLSPDAPGDFANSPDWLATIMDIGVAAFTLMPAVLAGYISYAIAGKPGLVAGMIGGWLATHLGTTVVDGVEQEVSAGFIGAMIAGLLAGHVVQGLKTLKVPPTIRPIMPILVIPILSSLVIGIVMLKMIGLPIAALMNALAVWLEGMGTGNAIVLAMILGAMIAFDMGGPVNKTAFFFGAGLITKGNYVVMGAIAAAICTPPLGMGLATLIRKSLWKDEQREAGKAALAMGMIGITEGAIPFAAAEPLKVIPCLVLGSSTAAVIAMLGGVGDHAPHGGPIVLPVIDNKLMYLLAIAAGTLVTALAINFLKSLNRPATES